MYFIVVLNHTYCSKMLKNWKKILKLLCITLYTLVMLKIQVESIKSTVWSFYSILSLIKRVRLIGGVILPTVLVLKYSRSQYTDKMQIVHISSNIRPFFEFFGIIWFFMMQSWIWSKFFFFKSFFSIISYDINITTKAQ